MHPAPSPPRAILAWALGALGGLLGAACGAADEAPLASEATSTWPAGTVLVVDEIPIRARDVDALCPAVHQLYPAYSSAHQRRLVLTNFSLNQAAVRSRDWEPRLRAEQESQSEWESLQAGAQPSLPVMEYAGSHEALGFGIWAHAQRLEEGIWSGPFDVIGQFVILRRDHFEPTTQSYSVSVLEFPYMDPEQLFGSTRFESMQAAHHNARLQIIDPDWAEFVPMEWQHEMRGKR